jgi:hypothetical protein
MELDEVGVSSLGVGKEQILDKLPDYVSSSDEDSNIAPSTRKRRKKTDKQWKKEKVFNTKEFAEQAVKSKGIWSLYHKNVDKDGNIDNIYRYNRVKFRGEQCQSGVYLSYPCHNTEIILYRSSLPHTCDKIPTKSKKKISETEIKVLFEFDNKLKPKKILELLQEKELELPTMTDLKKYLSLLRKQKFGPHTVSLGELERFLINHCTVPEDDNKGFIVSYEINYDEPSYFRFFDSSKTLLKLALNVNHVHADASYKLIWHGYPVLVVGTTDKIRQFHPFGFCICSNEKTADFVFLFEALKLGTAKVFNNQICPNTIVCDASSAIQNAFKQVFGEESVIVMCWFVTKSWPVTAPGSQGVFRGRGRGFTKWKMGARQPF